MFFVVVLDVVFPCLPFSFSGPFYFHICSISIFISIISILFYFIFVSSLFLIGRKAVFITLVCYIIFIYFSSAFLSLHSFKQ